MRENVAPQALAERHQISLPAAKNLQPGRRRRNVLSTRQSPMNLGQGEGRRLFPKHIVTERLASPAVVTER